MPDLLTSPITQPFQQRVSAWLRERKGAPDTLALWLHGADLPPVEMYGYEPADWVFAATPPQERETLAARLAEVIKNLVKLPDAAPPVSPWFAANVFSLACNLCPTRALADSMALTLSREIKPLHSVLRHPSVERHYRHALAVTQVDDRLSKIWLTLLQGQAYGSIQPDLDRDVRGLCYLSARDEKLVMQPAWDSIGRGLTYFASAVEKSDPRRQERGTRMNDAITLIFDPWLRERDDDAWNERLLSQAIKNHWPKWTHNHLSAFMRDSTPTSSDVKNGRVWKIRDLVASIFEPVFKTRKIDEESHGTHLVVTLKPEALGVEQDFFLPIRNDALRSGCYADNALTAMATQFVLQRWMKKESNREIRNDIVRSLVDRTRYLFETTQLGQISDIVFARYRIDAEYHAMAA